MDFSLLKPVKERSPLKQCNRCKHPAKRRGRISALVALPNGRYERKFLCAPCISDLQSGMRGARLAA